MKHNKTAVLMTITTAFTMLITACGAPAVETTAPVTTVAETNQSQETTAKENTSVSGETMIEETTIEEASVEENGEESEEVTTEASTVGTTDSSGGFTAESGKYKITIPKGWVVDSTSDAQITTFVSANENDYIEVVHATGDMEYLVEEMPDTADEYKRWITRSDDELDIVQYNVVNDENGQTYQYAVKYNSADADTKYLCISASYDLKAKEFISATAMVQTEGEEAINTVKAAMDSFKIIK